MKPIWDFLVSAIADSLGRGSGQLLVWILCFFVFIALFIPFYLVLKLFGFGTRAGGLRTTTSEDVLDAVTGAPKGGEVPESGKEFLDTLESAKESGLEIYKYLTYAIVAALIAGGVFFAIKATTANGLILVAIMLFAVAVIVFGQMDRFRRMMTSQPMTWQSPSINISRTFSAGAPTVIRMDNDAVRKAQDLLKSGKDLDLVCREIEPDYANWDSIRQQLFRTTLEAVLKASPSMSG